PKHGLPTRPDVISTGLDHLYQTPKNHVLDCDSVAVRHDVLKWLQKVLLEFETRQLFDFHESHRQLPKGVQGKEHHGRVGLASDLVKMLAEDLPNLGPLDSHTRHVVVADFYDFLETVHAWRFALT